MDLRRSIHQLLKEIGPGKMDSVAYDTAWVARLARFGEPIGEQALDWLREHQLPDGSWGAAEFRYHHDRLVCTLAAMIALAERGEERDRRRLQRAQRALEIMARGLGADPAGETVGFEMIVPTLVDEARDLGVIQNSGNGTLDKLAARMARYRAGKLESLPDRVINRFVTLAFSAEMVSDGKLHLLDVGNLQEDNGSVGHSPSATAYFLSHVRPGESKALQYLQSIAINGGMPDVAPFDIFERAWTLWNLAIAESLDETTLPLCQPHLTLLETTWKAKNGVGFASGYTPMDGDDTAMVYDVLTRYGYAMDVSAVLQYEESDYFRCYALEANPSLSANIHVLGALREAGFDVDYPPIQKILRFLRRTQSLQIFWLDKWHASPYYPTSHAVIAAVGYDDDLLDDSIYWIVETQNEDGSWGYYMPTAEETAYCLQALVIWKRHGHQVPISVLRRGASWLLDHAEPPYPPLWIGKCLYSPHLVVRSVVLSALSLVAQE